MEVARELSLDNNIGVDADGYPYGTFGYSVRFQSNHDYTQARNLVLGQPMPDYIASVLPGTLTQVSGNARFLRWRGDGESLWQVSYDTRGFGRLLNQARRDTQFETTDLEIPLWYSQEIPVEDNGVVTLWEYRPVTVDRQVKTITVVDFSALTFDLATAVSSDAIGGLYAAFSDGSGPSRLFYYYLADCDIFEQSGRAVVRGYFRQTGPIGAVSLGDYGGVGVGVPGLFPLEEYWTRGPVYDANGDLVSDPQVGVVPPCQLYKSGTDSIDLLFPRWASAIFPVDCG